MLYVFDMDDTLVTSYMRHPKKDYHAWEVLPGRVEHLKKLSDAGHTLGIATNQAAVGFGIVKQEEYVKKMQKVLKELGGVISPENVRACFAHERAKSPHLRTVKEMFRRKPNPGMLLELMKSTGHSKENTVFVGDRAEDEGAAKAAWCRFEHVDQHF